MMTFSEKLVVLRKIKHLTQDEFASAVGVSRQAVYKWESGQSYPEVQKLLEMKMLFGISIDDLLDDTFEIELPKKKRKKRMTKEEKAKIEAEVNAEENAAEAPATEEVKEEAAPVVEEVKAAPVEEVIIRHDEKRPVDLTYGLSDDMLLTSGTTEEKNAEITEKNDDYNTFCALLYKVCGYLARSIARDGEGATRLITCTVDGAKDEKSAEKLAKSVIGSALTKAAMFGSDANWGRVICAMGYSGEEFDPEKVKISFKSVKGEILVCEAGRGLVFDEDLAKEILSQDEVIIYCELHEGEGSATVWGCDLTYDYVKINGDYRS